MYCTQTQCLMQELQTIDMSAWQDDKRKSKLRERMTWLEFLPYQFAFSHFNVLYATCLLHFLHLHLNALIYLLNVQYSGIKLLWDSVHMWPSKQGLQNDTSCLYSHVLHLKSPSMILIKTSKSWSTTDEMDKCWAPRPHTQQLHSSLMQPSHTIIIKWHICIMQHYQWN